ncbi:hypothetical protein [Bacillus sp. AK031]
MLSCLLLAGFDRGDQLEISNIETTIIKGERLLRYDIRLKNTGKTSFKSEFDYPGQQHYGIEAVIRPNKKLAAQMEMVQDSKYPKMMMWSSGSTGLMDPGMEGRFHLEYKIKEAANLDKVELAALDATLLILDGVDIVKEFPLKKMR